MKIVLLTHFTCNYASFDFVDFVSPFQFKTYRRPFLILRTSQFENTLLLSSGLNVFRNFEKANFRMHETKRASHLLVQFFTLIVTAKFL